MKTINNQGNYKRFSQGDIIEKYDRDPIKSQNDGRYKIVDFAVNMSGRTTELAVIVQALFSPHQTYVYSASDLTGTISVKSKDGKTTLVDRFTKITDIKTLSEIFAECYFEADNFSFQVK